MQHGLFWYHDRNSAITKIKQDNHAINKEIHMDIFLVLQVFHVVGDVAS